MNSDHEHFVGQMVLGFAIVGLNLVAWSDMHRRIRLLHAAGINGAVVNAVKGGWWRAVIRLFLGFLMIFAGWNGPLYQRSSLFLYGMAIWLLSLLDGLWQMRTEEIIAERMRLEAEQAKESSHG